MKTENLKYAMRPWLPNVVQLYYVSHTPGDGGVDWGYVTNIHDAKPLNLYWQKRFSADCRYVGVVAQFIDFEPKYTAPKATHSLST